MPIPETDQTLKSVYDLIADASSDIVEITNENGIAEKVKILDTKKVYYKTQLINSPNFSRFVLELENFELLAEQCYFNMSKPAADQLSAQIKAYVNSFRYSVDAKSSESLRDKYNTQGTLLHELLRNKVEKAITLSGEAKKHFLGGFLGRDDQQDYQQ